MDNTVSLRTFTNYEYNNSEYKVTAKSILCSDLMTNNFSNHKDKQFPIHFISFMILGFYLTASLVMTYLYYKKRRYFPIKGAGPQLATLQSIYFWLCLFVPYVAQVYLMANPTAWEDINNVPNFRVFMKSAFMTARIQSVLIFLSRSLHVRFIQKHDITEDNRGLKALFSSDSVLSLCQLCTSAVQMVIFYYFSSRYNIDDPLFDWVKYKNSGKGCIIQYDSSISYGFNSTYVHIWECITVFICVKLNIKFPKKLGVSNEFIYFFILTFLSDMYYETSRYFGTCFIFTNDMWGNITKHFVFQLTCLYWPYIKARDFFPLPGIWAFMDFKLFIKSKSNFNVFANYINDKEPFKHWICFENYLKVWVRENCSIDDIERISSVYPILEDDINQQPVESSNNNSVVINVYRSVNFSKSAKSNRSNLYMNHGHYQNYSPPSENFVDDDDLLSHYGLDRIHLQIIKECFERFKRTVAADRIRKKLRVNEKVVAAAQRL